MCYTKKIKNSLILKWVTVGKETHNLFFVSIPDGANLSIFDHTFRCPCEVLWLLKINIVFFITEEGLGFLILISFNFNWPLVKEESLSEFGYLSQIRRKSIFRDDQFFSCKQKRFWFLDYLQLGSKILGKWSIGINVLRNMPIWMRFECRAYVLFYSYSY